MDPDELMRRFDERVQDKIEEEREELRISRCILFNQQDLLQRTLVTAAHRVAEEIGLAIESVGVGIKADHESKKFVPTLVVSAQNLSDVDVSDVEAQSMFTEAFREVNLEWAGIRREMHELARTFPVGDPISVPAFQGALATWMQHH